MLRYTDILFVLNVVNVLRLQPLDQGFGDGLRLLDGRQVAAVRHDDETCARNGGGDFPRKLRRCSLILLTDQHQYASPAVP